MLKKFLQESGVESMTCTLREGKVTATMYEGGEVRYTVALNGGMIPQHELRVFLKTAQILINE